MARKSSPSSQRPTSQPHVLEWPDGFYWQGGAGAEHGPFTTLAEAASDMEEGGVDAELDDLELPDRESLEDAEAELGVGWIDPLTGEPGGEGAPRLEDH